MHDSAATKTGNNLNPVIDAIDAGHVMHLYDEEQLEKLRIGGQLGVPYKPGEYCTADWAVWPCPTIVAARQVNLDRYRTEQLENYAKRKPERKGLV